MAAFCCFRRRRQTNKQTRTRRTGTTPAETTPAMSPRPRIETRWKFQKYHVPLYLKFVFCQKGHPHERLRMQHLVNLSHFMVGRSYNRCLSYLVTHLLNLGVIFGFRYGFIYIFLPFLLMASKKPPISDDGDGGEGRGGRYWVLCINKGD